MTCKGVWGLFVVHLVFTFVFVLFWASLSKLSRIVHITSHSNNTAINVTNHDKATFRNRGLPVLVRMQSIK